MEPGSLLSGPSANSRDLLTPVAAPKSENAAWSSAAGRPNRKSRRLRRVSKVLGIGLLVAASSVAGLLAISWVRSQGAVEVVQAQVDDVRVGKVDQAYALFSSGYQAGVSLPMFRRWVRRQDRLGKVQNLQFWGRSVWGETAVLWGSFRDDLGHRYPVRYLLIREKGSWRIDGFHLSAEFPVSFPATTRFIQI